MTSVSDIDIKSIEPGQAYRKPKPEIKVIRIPRKVVAHVKTLFYLIGTTY